MASPEPLDEATALLVILRGPIHNFSKINIKIIEIK